jgi:chromosome partitioning protein
MGLSPLLNQARDDGDFGGMSTISAVGGKGGIAKSTICRALACEAARGGLSVKIADLDRNQGTSIDWHRDRVRAGLEPTVDVALHADIKSAVATSAAYDLLIIDSPGLASGDTLRIARVSDLVIMPTGPSLDDLRPAVRAANSLIRDGIPITRLLFVLSRIASQPEAEAARGYLVEAGYQVAGGWIPERVAYRQAQDIGLAITEVRYPGLRQTALACIKSIIRSVPDMED